jgi:hypothetical protein
VAADELDRLYATPLHRFVQERNELAKRLRRAGEREAADEVAARAKPTVPAWAVNQLARRRAPELRRLLRATDELRAAHGGGDPAAFSRARGDLASAVDILLASAREILEEAGRPPTDATLTRVAETLRAAAADDETRGELERGRLVQEHEAGGFAPLAGLVPKAAPARSRKQPAPRPDREAALRRERETKLKEARRSAEQAEQEAAAARREADRLERAAAAARRRAERLEQQR